MKVIYLIYSKDLLMLFTVIGIYDKIHIGEENMTSWSSLFRQRH